MNNLTFKVDRMYRLPDAGSLCAFADVVINDAIIIRGVRVLKGKKGMFIGLPQEQGKDNKWYDQIVCRSAQVYDELSMVCIAHYHMGAEEASNE